MGFSLIFIRLKKAAQIIKSPKLFFAFFRYGVFAGVEHRAILNSDLRTIIDIGANKGQFALACRKWASNANIISFEPLPGPFKTFNTLFKGDNHVRIINSAIGPKNERALIHLSLSQDSSSLLPIGQNQERLYPGTHETGVVEIDVRVLSFFLSPEDIQRPSMLKLDVQGFEFEVLKGSDSLIENFDFIYCECSFIELYRGQKLACEVIDWLSQRNFNLVGIFNTAHDSYGWPIQADFLFDRHGQRISGSD